LIIAVHESAYGGIMRPENHQRVLERLATTDRRTIVLERDTDGKMGVQSGSSEQREGVFSGPGAVSA
jgi:hypothetical protein